jgi:hypothetical protein
MTKKGLQAIATYYEVTDEWCDATTGQTFNIKHYFDLLLLVKKQSKKDHVWISFYDGLHRHAALMMCLFCSKLNLMTNEVKYGSLSAEYITRKVSIKGIKQQTKTPLGQFIGIYIDEDIKVPMLTMLVTLRAFVPKLQVTDLEHGDLDSLLKALWTYSENLSNTKRTSADKSMMISLAEILDTIGKMSKPQDRNNRKHWPILTFTIKRQIDLTLPIHLSNMDQEDNNNYACYKYSDKLTGKKQRKYSLDGMNSKLRGAFAKTLPLAGQKKERISVPLAFHY